MVFNVLWSLMIRGSFRFFLFLLLFSVFRGGGIVSFPISDYKTKNKSGNMIKKKRSLNLNK